MKMLRAAAAALTLTFAAPALAQSSGISSGSTAPSGSVAETVTRGSAPPQAYHPGDFPLLDLRGWTPERDWRDDRPNRPDRPDRPDRKRWRGYYGYGIGIGGLIDRDRGYFAEGGAVEVVNNHATYDYDRGYPYDHYSGVHEPQERHMLASREAYCQVKWTRDRRTGEDAAVRVCRN